MIEVRHVSHTFGPRWALKNLSFSLNKGDFLFLSGPSGAGKTTLLRLLIAGLPLLRGHIRIAGYELSKLKRRQIPLLRREVGIVFQDFKILPERSVFDNVALSLEVRCAPRRIIDKRVRAVLRSLHLEEHANTACGHLSGGEQQRVAIARSIVVNPQVLLADEPTGNLDQNLAWRLMDVFRQFHTYGTTIILATHNQQLIEAYPAAKVLHLKGGKYKAANWPGGLPLNDGEEDIL